MGEGHLYDFFLAETIANQKEDTMDQRLLSENPTLILQALQEGAQFEDVLEALERQIGWSQSLENFLKDPYKDWDTLSKVVYLRTYSRTDNNTRESWKDTVDRVIKGNISPDNKLESDFLRFIMLARTGMAAGRGLWMSGSPNHLRHGATALVNCWALAMDDWAKYVQAQDLLMLGGGVGMSVEHRYVSKLPKIKQHVDIVHIPGARDADFIVPDSREGWNELTRRVLEAWFVTGRGFTYSTVCVRNAGEPIRGFGGTASGPRYLVDLVNNISKVLSVRVGKKIRPCDAADLLCAIGEMVKSGNVRRSALIIIGDPWDKEYLKMKRWDIQTLPSWRASANFSVVCDDVDDLHKLFWQTYEHGEAFGIFNRELARTDGRVGEKKDDSGVISVNPCGEIPLENGEPCNLQEQFLSRMPSLLCWFATAMALYRYGKRVTLGSYHWQNSAAVIAKNRRIGVGVTGVLGSKFWSDDAAVDAVYKAIILEDERYSEKLGINKSIRITTVKPSGTLSKIGGSPGEIVTPGIHPAYSKYYIQRIRFGSNDPLLPLLRDAGHRIEPEIQLDGSRNDALMVVDFPMCAGDAPTADGGFDTWRQLDELVRAQRLWSDNSVSVTVYYKREEIPQIKEWLANNLSKIKTISFLLHEDHGFQQAPLEAITEERYHKEVARLKELDLSSLMGNAEVMETIVDECEGGACPIR